MPTMNDPKWWNAEHTSTWERVKAALKADWEQTKHDFGSKTAPDLHQDATDTLKQAIGTQPVPSAATTTGWDRWDDAEPTLRYGHAARAQYKEHDDWNDALESKLREEWNDLKSGRTWDEAKHVVRRGWESTKR